MQVSPSNTNQTEYLNQIESLKQRNRQLEQELQSCTLQSKQQLEQEHLSKEIEERKQIEQNLRESQQRLDRIVNSNDDGLIVLDDLGIVRFVNPAAAQLFSRQSQDLLGQELGLPLVSGTSTELEIPRPNGELLIVEMRLVEIPWEGKMAYLASLRNISDRKRTEAALRESEARFHYLADKAPVLIWMSDQYGHLYFFNQTWLEFTGNSLEQEQENGWLAGVHPQDLVNLLTLRQNALAGKSKFQHEYRLRRADGQYRMLTDTGVPRFTPGGEFLGYIGSSLDITERQEAEQELQASETKFRQIAENIREVFYIMSPQGEQFHYLSPAFVSIWGRTCKSLYEHPQIWLDTIHEADRQRVEKAMAQQFQDVTEFNQEYRIIHADGSIRWIWARTFPVKNQTGKLERWVGIAEDISDRTLAQHALRQSQQQYQELSQHLTRFSLNLKQIHRLNTTNYDGIEDLFQDYLETGCQIFGLEHGIISQIDGDIYTIRAIKSAKNLAQPGLQLPLNLSYCVEVIKTGKTIAHKQIPPQQKLKIHPLWQNLRLETYISTPIRVNQKIYGTLNFSASSPRNQAWETYEQEIIELMAQAIGKAITTAQSEQERAQTLEELQTSERFVHQIAETMPNILYIYDLKQKTNIYLNRSIAEILGYTAMEIRAMGSQCLVELLHPEDLIRIDKLHQRFETAKDNDIIESEYRMKQKNQEWCWLYSREIIFTRSQDGFPAQILGTATDISHQKQIEQELQQTNQQLTTWVQELQQRNQEINLLGEMSEVLQACLTLEEAYQALATLIAPLFPFSSGVVLMLNNDHNLVEAVATWGQDLDSETLFTPHECWALRRGRVHWLENWDSGLICPHIHKQDTAKGKASLCVPMIAQGESLGLFYLCVNQASQLTATKRQLIITVAEHISIALANLQLRDTLQQQNIRDPLTGLFNRRYMEESLAREVCRASRKGLPLGIIMLDVDHFKKFNDHFGHEAGDMVLRELGKFLKHSVRNSDITCRYGGEELMLILPESSLAETQKRAEHIREGVKRLKLEHRYRSLGQITVSIGVASFPEHGLSGEAVIWAADVALYQAKAQGRDRVVIAS